MRNLFPLDAAEVVLFKFIDQIKNEKGEVTAIEMSFEFIDDFQDPIQGGLYGMVNTLFVNPGAQEDGTSELQVNAIQPHKTEPAPPAKFNSHNHVLQWMVRTSCT